MEDQKQIKIIFNNSEKILKYIPSSFDELKELFHELFEEADININYIFKYNQNKYKNLLITLLITKEAFQKAMDDLKEMNNPAIYVDEDKDDFLNSCQHSHNYNINITNPYNSGFDILNNKTSSEAEYVIPNNNEEEQKEEDDYMRKSIDSKCESLKEYLARIEENLKDEIDKNKFLKEQIEKIIDINEKNEGIN